MTIRPHNTLRRQKEAFVLAERFAAACREELIAGARIEVAPYTRDPGEVIR